MATGKDAPTAGPPIRALGNGRYSLQLSGGERAVLRDVGLELIKQVEAGEDDGSMFRLFPPGYSEDLLRQVEFDRLMHGDLQASHLQALQTLTETAELRELDEAQLSAWMRALNQIRLILGTRLDVTEDMDEDELADDESAGGAYALYTYLGYLQGHAVDALSGSVDPAGEPGADDLGPEA